MFSLHGKQQDQLLVEADARGVTIQELLRAVILPEWFMWVKLNRPVPQVTLGLPADSKLRKNHHCTVCGKDWNEEIEDHVCPYVIRKPAIT